MTFTVRLRDIQNALIDNHKRASTEDRATRYRAKYEIHTTSSIRVNETYQRKKYEK
jgi:hypothetical protein